MLDNNCDENEPWLSINGPNMKESKWQSRLVTLLCEDLHERMQHYMRQHFAYRCGQHAHPGGPTSWRQPTIVICMDIREDIRRGKDPMKIEYCKIRSASCECTWNARAILIHSEDY